MADKKISELNTTTTIDGTELLLVVQGGTNKKLQLSTMLANLNTQTGSSFVVNQQRIASNFYISPVSSAARGDQTFLLFANASTNLIGIGTASPSAKLDIRDSWSDSSSVFESFVVNTTDAASNSNVSTRLASLKIGGTERFGIKSNGDVLTSGNITATSTSQYTMAGRLRVNRSTGTNDDNTNLIGGIIHVQSPTGVGGSGGVTATGTNAYLRLDAYNSLNNNAVLTSSYTVTTAEMPVAVSFFQKNAAADIDVVVPDGTEGQIKTFVCTSSNGAGNPKIAPVNRWFNTKIQLGTGGVSVGRACTLIFTQGKWACIGTSNSDVAIVT